MSHPHTFLVFVLVAIVFSPTILADGPPPSIDLTGVIRDFKRDHVDFNVMPIGGPGHYAGNVDLAIGNDQRPAFLGGGYKVVTQWTNSGADPIAPHLYIAPGIPGVVQVANAPSVHDNATEDTWDSSAGPYGPGNIGPVPTYDVGADMPTITAPTGLDPSEGNLTWGSKLLSSDVHCDDLSISTGGTVVVVGSRVILCEGEFTLSTHADLVLAPGATLQLYVKQGIVFMPHSTFNSHPFSGIPSRATIYNLGTTEMRISQPNGEVYATVVAPTAIMRVMPTGQFYGNFIGMDLDVQANAGFHVDMAVPMVLDACGVLINDTAGAAGVAGDAAISSPTTFAQWYREILGVNMAASHTITLNLNGAGVYEYLDSSFYPIDDQLFGNDGDLRNNYFTYQLEAQFEYESCTGQFIEFKGADDAWLFINGALTIDLCGIVPGTEQVVELDRLGLQDGDVYSMQLFYANRAPNDSEFHLRTNVELFSDDVVVTVSLPFD